MGLYVGNTKYKVMSGNNKASLFPVYPYNSEVEYLETNGGCNIYTDYIPSGNNIRIKGKFKYNGYTDNTQWLGWYSAYTNEQTQTFRIIRYTSTNDKVYLYNGSKASGGGALAPVEIGGIYEFDFNKTALVFNGVNYNITLNNTANTGQLYIFNIKFKGRFYYLKVYDNDILIHDYIPVRVNQTGYVYDRVTNKLFGNNPNVSGSIILGPDITTIYDAEVEYLESTGTQYIDTGFTPNQDSRIQLDVLIPSLSTGACTFGGSANGAWRPGFTVYGGNTTYQMASVYNNSDVTASSSYKFQSNNRYILDLNKNKYTVYKNSVEFYSYSHPTGDFQLTKSIELFRLNIATPRYGKFRLYSAIISDDGVLARDLIPVRVGRVGYMYDTISHKLFGNAGTGSFIVGNDKN